MWWWRWQESFNAVADTPPPHPTPTIGSFSELKQQRRQQQRNKELGNGDYFVIIVSSSDPLLLREHAANGPWD